MQNKRRVSKSLREAFEVMNEINNSPEGQLRREKSLQLCDEEWKDIRAQDSNYQNTGENIFESLPSRLVDGED